MKHENMKTIIKAVGGTKLMFYWKCIKCHELIADTIEGCNDIAEGNAEMICDDCLKEEETKND